MVDPTTTHLHLNLPQPSDSMADVANGFNNAWAIISAAPKPAGVVAGPALPTSGYTVGQVVYNTAWKSSFILLAIDANWGYIWRPIHAKFGPWVTPGTAILADTVNYGMASEAPIAYRISNTGEFELTGGLKRTTAPNTLPNGFPSLLNQMPVGCRPEKTVQWLGILHKSSFGTGLLASSGNYYLKMWLTVNGNWNFNIFNNATGTADADTMFFNDKVRFQICTRTDL